LDSFVGPGDFYLSANGGTGTYTLSGGVLVGADEEFIGFQGYGNFNQSGGVHAIIAMSLGGSSDLSATGRGTYTLTGGNIVSVVGYDLPVEIVGDSGIGSFNQSGGANECGSLTLSNSTGATGIYTLSAGILDAGSETIGNSDYGSFSQTGGTNYAGGLVISDQGSGTYALSAGSLVADDEAVAYSSGTGSLIQNGGSNSVSGSLEIGRFNDGYDVSTGTYTLNSGILTAASETVSAYGLGIFNQTGGTNTVTSSIYVGSGEGGIGVYNQSGGITNLTAGDLILGVDGGTAFYGIAAAIGTYYLSNGASLNVVGNETIGDLGIGRFNQSGGTNSLAASLTLGFQGIGNYNQTGGTTTLTSGDLILGSSAGIPVYDISAGMGTYTLGTGGSLSVGGDEIVGYQGIGDFIQSGGTNSVAGSLYIASSGDPSGVITVSTGTYTLTGGLLSVSSNAYIGGSNSASGGYGSLTVSGSGSLTVAGTLKIWNSTSSTFAIQGGNATISNTYNLGTITQSAGGFTCTYTTNSGVVMQSGGIANLGTLLNTGSYTLSGGSLTATTETIGYSTPATFNQSNGTNSMTTLNVAVDSGSTGTYTLSGGQLAVSGSATFGTSTSTVVASLTSSAGGQFSVAGTLNVGSSGFVTLNGSSNSFTGVANNGALTFNGINNTIGTGNITGSSGTLTIGSSATLILAGGGQSSQAALSIAAAGTLVMNNASHDSLILQYNNGTAGTPNAAIRQYLQNGFNNGHWDAGGTLPNPTTGAITSTLAASTNSYSIGYADGNDNLLPGILIAGITVGQELIKFTYAGDTSLDGQVNLTDLTILANHFGSTGAQWDQADFSYDGTVNLVDLSILASHFGEGVGSPLLRIRRTSGTRERSPFGMDMLLVEESDPAFAAELAIAFKNNPVLAAEIEALEWNGPDPGMELATMNGSAEAFNTSLAQAVPEPSAIVLLPISALALLRRRRKR
jgi:hypothetical protein